MQPWYCVGMHYTYSLSCFMHSQLWREIEQHERGGRRKWQLNNNHTMQCNVTCRWMDALHSLAVMFHAFPWSCEGEKTHQTLEHMTLHTSLEHVGRVGLTHWGGKRRKTANQDLLQTASSHHIRADEWMLNTHYLSCSMRSQLWRGEQHEGEERENGN